MVCVGYSVRGEGEGEEAGKKEKERKEKEGGREGKKREGKGRRGKRGEKFIDILHNSEYFNLNHTCVRAMM